MANEHSANTLAVVGLACWFAGIPSLSEFWDKVLKDGTGANTGDGNRDNISDGNDKRRDYAGNVISNRAAQSLHYINNASELNSLLLVAVDSDHKGVVDPEELVRILDPAGLTKKTGRTFDFSTSKSKSIKEVLAEAVNALGQHRRDLVLIALAEYKMATGLPSGFAFIALQRLEDAIAQEHHIYATIAGLSHADLNANPMVSAILFETSVRGLLTSILSVYHATIPPLQTPSELVEQASLLGNISCAVNSRTRPWIVSGYDELHRFTRTAVLLESDTPTTNDATAHGAIFVSQYTGSSPCRLLTPRDSEIFVLQAVNRGALLGKVRSWIGYCNAFSETKNPADLSYSMSVEPTEQGVRLAIVAASVHELYQKLHQVEIMLATGMLNSLPSGVFYGAINADCTPHKLAFMLPGLGSAYQDMLFDLCLHYPEVREVFDYVDGLALAEGEKTLPSTLLFPNNSGLKRAGVEGRVEDGEDGNPASTAMLATMDSAVVTVLLAEWAIYILLRKFGITPDALIGCSTGEFAAFTMGGVADIAGAARMFYKLSVSVARSLPRDRLLNLASMKVDAGMDAIESVVKQLDGAPLFVTAEFTSRHSIVTGSRDAVAHAAELFKESGVQCHYLPIAIPYHTPLVEGAVSAQHDEVAQVPLSTPTIPIWSCASAQPYGPDLEIIRRTTTELFARTILFERTIKAVHESGVDIFIEVGPRDNLAAFASEIFANEEFGTTDGATTILRSDVMGRNSLTQMNCLLAELFCSGYDIDLSVLFKNREVKRVDLKQLPTTEQVMTSYMKELESFHEQLMQVQSRVLNEYLSTK